MKHNENNTQNKRYIKVIPLEFINYSNLLDYFQKLNELSVVQINSVVPILNYSFLDSNCFNLTIPKYSYSLQQYIDTNFQNYNYMLLSIVKTLQSLHAVNIIHSNLKPSNILFDSNHSLYLSDYMINSIRNIECLAVYDLYYLSPEQLSNKYITYSSDIWSLGCLLKEMKIIKENNNNINEIIEKMLEINPNKRISLNDIEIYLMNKIESDNNNNNFIEKNRQLFINNSIISMIDRNYQLTRNEYKEIIKQIDVIENLVYSYTDTDNNNNNKYRNNILFILIEIFWKSHNMQIYDFIANKLKYFIKITDSKGRAMLIDEILFGCLTSSYYIDISQKSIGSNGVIYLSHYFHIIYNVKTLDLSYSGIDSYGIKILTLNLNKLIHLRQLYVDNNPFSDTGLKYLLPYLSLIIDGEGLLDLSNIGLFDYGFNILCDHFSSVSDVIISIDVSENLLTDESLCVMSKKCDCLKKLKSIDLDDNTFTDKGTEYIVNLIKKLRNLKEIILEFTDLSSSSIQYLRSFDSGLRICYDDDDDDDS